MELKGKSINFLGDSITEGVGCENPQKRYHSLIKEKCHLKEVYTYGISGSRLAHQRVPSECTRFDLCFCGRAFDMNPDADIIIVFGGTNDYGHGDAPFGTLEDKTPATFCGAVDHLMNFLPERYAGKVIVFLASARRDGDLEPSAGRMAGEDSKPLKDYVDVICKKGEQYHIPVLNLYEKLPINPNNEDDKEKYAPDGLHFNEAGHEMLADCLIDFLGNL